MIRRRLRAELKQLAEGRNPVGVSFDSDAPPSASKVVASRRQFPRRHWLLKKEGAAASLIVAAVRGPRGQDVFPLGESHLGLQYRPACAFAEPLPKREVDEARA
jgi:hypothetical protein